MSYTDKDLWVFSVLYLFEFRDFNWGNRKMEREKLLTRQETVQHLNKHLLIRKGQKRSINLRKRVFGAGQKIEKFSGRLSETNSPNSFHWLDFVCADEPLGDFSQKYSRDPISIPARLTISWVTLSMRISAIRHSDAGKPMRAKLKRIEQA
jgi:hypothetical protein